MTDWNALAALYAGRTDKFRNGYAVLYEELCNSFPSDARILEIGVAYGGSMALWKALFPEGTVVGVDNGTDFHIMGGQPEIPEGTTYINAGQTDPNLPDFVRPFGPYDMIVDDASHNGNFSRVTFELLWPLVVPGGWYVLEDWGVGIEGNDPYFGAYGGTSQFDLAACFLARCGRYPWRADGQRSDISEFRGRSSIIAIRKKEA